MDDNDKQDFARLLAEVMSGYGKPLPDGVMLGTWFKLLRPFPAKTITAAFSAYVMERPDFAPAPNGIVARCRLLDGRPSDDEAWALALKSRDERETVVWTDEMAVAFGQCQAVLHAGDEVGARMAFKDAYTRMVAEARAQGRPTVWTVSPGWDGDRRVLALHQAVAAGQLEAPAARLLLPNGAMNAEIADVRPEGLKRVLEVLRELEDPAVKAERISQARMDAEERRTKEIAAQVSEYRTERGSNSGSPQ